MRIVMTVVCILLLSLAVVSCGGDAEEPEAESAVAVEQTATEQVDQEIAAEPDTVPSDESVVADDADVAQDDGPAAGQDEEAVAADGADQAGNPGGDEAEDVESTLLSLAQATEDQQVQDGDDASGPGAEVTENDVADGPEEEARPESYLDFVKQSVLYYDEERTVGEVIDAYPYFTEVTWKEYEFQGRIMVEATASYDIPSVLTALRDEDPEADGKFVGQSLGELASVSTIMYFSVDKDMTSLLPPSSSGLAHCKNGKTTTFMPGGVQLVYDDMPPRIKDVYRQCFN